MWATILEVVLKVVGFLIDRNKLSKEAIENFFAFVKKAGEDMGSVKLKEYGDAQIEWLKKNPWRGEEIKIPVMQVKVQPKNTRGGPNA